MAMDYKLALDLEMELLPIHQKMTTAQSKLYANFASSNGVVHLQVGFRHLIFVAQLVL
jgi:hypothetical protein